MSQDREQAEKLLSVYPEVFGLLGYPDTYYIKTIHVPSVKNNGGLMLTLYGIHSKEHMTISHKVAKGKVIKFGEC